MPVDPKLALLREMRAESDALWLCLWPWRWPAYFRHWARYRELAAQLEALDRQSESAR